MQNTREENQGLTRYLLEQGILDVETLQNTKNQYQARYESLKQAVLGRLFLVDMEVQELQVIDLASETELHHFLFPDIPFQASEWDKRGSHFLLVNEADGTFLRYLPCELSEPYGLVAADVGSYLYQSEILTADYLPLTPNYLYAAVFRGSPRTAPYDLHLSPDQKILVIADRGRGTLRIIESQTFKVLHSKQLAAEGSLSCLNLAFDLSRQCLYITESKSATLFVFNLVTGELQSQKLGLGLLSNLVYLQDQDQLYLLTTKPQQELVCVSLKDWQVHKRIKLKGELFQPKNNDPADLLVVSPDQRHILCMTYQNTPTPFTPIISVIDTLEQKTLRRYALKDGVKPALILFGHPNPYKTSQTQTFQTFLLEQGILQPEQLKDFENQTSFVEHTQIATVSEPLLVSDFQNFDAVMTPPPSQNILTFSQTEQVHCIVNLLIEAFYEKTKINLADKPRVMGYLEAEAEALYQNLQTHSAVQVEIKRIYGDQQLQFLLKRRELQLKLELNAYLKNILSFLPPERCPFCNKDLGGQWQCPSCDYEINNPIHTFKQKTASANNSSFLPLGHFLLTEPAALKVYEVNRDLKIMATHTLNPIDFAYPQHALFISAATILVLDPNQNQVLEMTIEGEKIWQYPSERSPLHPLRAPSMVTYYTLQNQELRILIVDQGHHRVLETDKNGQIHWYFGQRGESGSGPAHLNQPTTIQYTPERTYLVVDSGNQRVLEINAEKEIERIFDRSTTKLRAPVAAQRLLNGHTLIADAERQEVLEFDSKANLIRGYSYQLPPEAPLRFEPAPYQILALPTQDIFLWNESKILRLNRLKPKQRLISALAELKTEGGLLNTSSSSNVNAPARAAEDLYFKSTKQAPHRLKTPVGAKQQSGEARLQSLLSRSKSEQNQTSADGQIQQAAEVYQKPDLELSSGQLYTIDRRRNGVVRINRKGSVIWHFGFDVGQNLAKPCFVYPSKRRCLITDSEHHRVLEISRADREVVLELMGPKEQKLISPRSALPTRAGHILIADLRNQRLVELSRQNEVIWQFKQEGLIGAPQHAEELEDGDILFTDSLHNRVVQVNRAGEVNWYYGKSLLRGPEHPLFGPTYATRLPNGNTLICDTRNHRVLEVNLRGENVWECKGKLDYLTQSKMRDAILNPVKAIRLKNGNTQIIHHHSARMVEVTPAHEVVWAYIMGRDVFLSTAGGSQRHEQIKPSYNRIDKRILDAARQKGQRPVEVFVQLMDGCQMKSIRASVIMLELEKFGMVIKTFPPPEDLMADRLDNQFVLTFVIMVEQPQIFEIIQAQLENIAEVLAVRVQDLSEEI